MKTQKCVSIYFDELIRSCLAVSLNYKNSGGHERCAERDLSARTLVEAGAYSTFEIRLMQTYLRGWRGGKKTTQKSSNTSPCIVPKLLNFPSIPFSKNHLINRWLTGCHCSAHRECYGNPGLITTETLVVTQVSQKDITNELASVPGKSEHLCQGPLGLGSPGQFGQTWTIINSCVEKTGGPRRPQSPHSAPAGPWIFNNMTKDYPWVITCSKLSYSKFPSSLMEFRLPCTWGPSGSLLSFTFFFCHQ